MSQSKNIETLFKETFDQFEADVNPATWAGIQQGLSSGSASSTTKFSLGKIIGSIGLIAVGIAAASIWHLFSEKKEVVIPVLHNNNKSENLISIPIDKNIQTVIPERRDHPQTQGNATNKSTSAPIHNKSLTTVSEDRNQIEGIKQSPPKTNAIVTNNVSPETNSSSEVTNVGMPGFAGLMRGNKPYNPANQKSEYNNSTPTANIFSNTTSGDAPLTVEFINNGVASSLSWNFGDGTVSGENMPTHTFTKAGIYNVTLTAKNSLGSVSDKVTIEVKQVSEILNAPNIFTPNEDGENDVFYFEMKNISSIGVVIFNQKQGVVYDWNVLDGNWNGKLKNGSDAPEGIYYYSVQANGADGITHSKKGSVFLKRH
ncbi:MAG TPA: gliding motility-associated C-terminal domain-containing protein [Bacteroidia bacterium]|nr:gliding motility-associated C-terminal domain-containing protein [Bacteroidia bacterium]